MLSNHPPHHGAYRCLACDSTGFVCVNHRDHPWAPVSNRADACGCGAGTPCRLCNAANTTRRLETNVVYLGLKPSRLH